MSANDSLLDTLEYYLRKFEDSSLWYGIQPMHQNFYGCTTASNISTTSSLLRIENSISTYNNYIKLHQSDSSSIYDRIRYNSTDDIIEIGTPDSWITINESIIDKPSRWYYSTAKDFVYKTDSNVGIKKNDPNYLLDVNGKFYVNGNMKLRYNKSDFLTESESTIELMNKQNVETSLDVGIAFTSIFGKGPEPVINSALFNSGTGRITINFDYNAYNIEFIKLGHTNTPDKIGIKIYRSGSGYVEYSTLNDSFISGIIDSSSNGDIVIIENTVQDTDINQNGQINLNSISNITKAIVFVQKNGIKIYSQEIDIT